MKCLVTGGAGFIGSNLVDALVERGDHVTVYDNLSGGKREFIAHHVGKEGFRFVEADLLDLDRVKQAMQGQEVVFHLGANPDVRLGAEEGTDRDTKQGVLATYNVLEAMRLAGVKKIVFSSSSTVYGENVPLPTPEDYGPMAPISFYAAAKLGAEALITAFGHNFGIQCWIYRFANVIGRNGTHGILVDFMRKLKADNTQLEILGNGKQQKSYLLVEGCVAGMLYGLENAPGERNFFNLGTEDQITVTRIAEVMVDELGLKDVKFNYTGGERGWKGDVPKMHLSIEKMKALGWSPGHNSELAIRSSIRLLKPIYWDAQEG